jgi:3-oxoacyl-[acyl-carrier-protein] synthase-1
MSTGDEKPELITAAFLLPLLENLGLPIAPGNVYPVCRAHAAVPAAVALADRLMSTSSIKRTIILAVDSYLDSFSLEWLARHGRLKSDENPTGLMPGEAGACFLVEEIDAARKRGAKIRAVVTGVGVAKEANDFFSGLNNRGVSLCRAIQQALQVDGAAASFSGDLVSDHNGEEWRAMELAGARLLLDAQLNRDAPLILPAACIGDVGAASGAVAVGVAVRAFARNYASSDRALVLCSSDHGDVGAILLRKTPESQEAN